MVNINFVDNKAFMDFVRKDGAFVWDHNKQQGKSAGSNAVSYGGWEPNEHWEEYETQIKHFGLVLHLTEISYFITLFLCLSKCV